MLCEGLSVSTTFLGLITMIGLAVLGGSTLHAEQTIVFFRHGEKPTGGLGQLTCQA